MPLMQDIKEGKYRDPQSGRDLTVKSVYRANDVSGNPEVAHAAGTVNFVYDDEPGTPLSMPYHEFAVNGRFTHFDGAPSSDASPVAEPSEGDKPST